MCGPYALHRGPPSRRHRNATCSWLLLYPVDLDGRVYRSVSPEVVPGDSTDENTGQVETSISVPWLHDSKARSHVFQNRMGNARSLVPAGYSVRCIRPIGSG